MTYAQYLAHQISALQTNRLTVAVQAVGVSVISIIIVALLPQVLIETVYKNAALLSAPPIFTYIPMVALAVVVGEFVASLLYTLNLNARIAKMRNELYDIVLAKEVGSSASVEVTSAVAEALAATEPKKRRGRPRKSSK